MKEVSLLAGIQVSSRMEKSITGNYLVLSLPEQERILHYQLEMIKYNPPPQVLAVEKRRVDNRNELRYAVKEMISLGAYSKQPLCRQDLLIILESLFRCLNGCKKYFLYDHCFLLDSEYVFIHPVNKELGFVYVPLQLPDVGSHQLKQFLGQLAHSMGLPEKATDLKMKKKLADLSEAPVFTKYDLLELIKQGKYPAVPPNSFCREPEKPFTLEPKSAEAKDKKTGMINVTFLALLGLEAAIMAILTLLADYLAPNWKSLGTFGGILFILTVVNLSVLYKTGKRKEQKEDSREWQEHLLLSMAKENDVLKQEMESYRYSLLDRIGNQKK